jgi:hypothetical protein
LPPLKRRSTKGPISYQIGSAELPDGQMLTTELKGQQLSVTLNTDHPAFAALYQPLQAMGEAAGADLRTAVELLLLAHTRTSYQLGLDGGDMLRAWGETYGKMLQRS